MRTNEPKDAPVEVSGPVAVPEPQDAPVDVPKAVAARGPVKNPEAQDTPDTLPEPAAVDDAARARRAQIIEQVRVATALEGGQASAPVEALQEKWIAGRISIEELRAEAQRMQDAREWSGKKWGTWLIVTVGGSVALAGVLIAIFGLEGGSVQGAIRVWGVTAAILNIAAAYCRVSAHYGKRNTERRKAVSWKDVDGLGKTISVVSAAYIMIGLFAAAR